MALLGSHFQLLKSIRLWISIFMIGLMISGITAFPLEWELEMANALMNELHWSNNLSKWIGHIYNGVKNTNQKYPFMAYGTDWLAFAHLIIAVAFIGPLRDPVRNIWVIEFGLIACFAIFPLAFIAGSIRGIPLYWRFIDCSFGIVGGVLLLICYKKTKQLVRIVCSQNN